MTRSPNIFDYATGELSQDAFLAWLARWADNAFKSADKNLHEVAKNFLVKLCDDKIQSCEIETVDLYLQYEKTDVVIDINAQVEKQKSLIVIEDKTGTGQHGDQLSRYKKAITKHINDGIFKGRTPYFVYLKTHDYIIYETELCGFKNFNRRDFLNVLEAPQAKKIRNQIFIDYVTRLRRLEDESQAFLNMQSVDWSYAQWSGFLMALCEILKGGANFRYVPNRSGGFLGAWFGWNKTEDMEAGDDLYFQIEANPKPSDSNHKSDHKGSRRPFILTLRLATESRENTSRLRHKIGPNLIEKFKNKGVSISTKNQRLGRSMRLLTFTDVKIEDGPVKTDQGPTDPDPIGPDSVGALAREVKMLCEILKMDN